MSSVQKTKVEPRNNKLKITKTKDLKQRRLWLIHADVQQKPTQYCEAIILQLKLNKFFKKAKGVLCELKGLKK